MSVHPRTHGEHPAQSTQEASSIGSSPHARGTCSIRRTHSIDSRFIPARTGNMNFVISPVDCIPVHPRTHGEHLLEVNWLQYAGGSSPHARGTSRFELPERIPDRFIPARTGNIRGSVLLDYPNAVHPRTHGEHTYQLVLCHRHAGSSPHARGTYAMSQTSTAPNRFIPARTGNIVAGSRKAKNISVHPRTHGEHAGRLLENVQHIGSSPHARGTLGVIAAVSVVSRFIPARTGNIFAHCSAVISNSVHPRTHGEHYSNSCANVSGNGSSPHARGTFQEKKFQFTGERFIPARTGNIQPAVYRAR